MSEPLCRSLNDAVEAWLEATGRFAESEFISGETQQIMNRAFGDAARSGIIVFKGVDATKGKPRVHEAIDPIHFSEHRTLWPQKNRIEPWSDAQNTGECVRNLGTDDPDRTWNAVQVLEPGFSDWINGIKAKHRGEIAAFLKLPRWDLLTVLAWIATRDAIFALDVTRNAMPFSRVDIRLSLRKAALERAGQPEKANELISLREAWTHHLAPVMANGVIRAFATRVSLSRSSAIVMNAPGVTLPEEGALGALLRYELFDGDRAPCALRPIEHLMASQWAEYHDVSLSRDEVMALWPAPVQAIAPKVAAERTGIPVNDRSVWTHAEAAAWVATGDASKDNPNTISGYSDDDRAASGNVADGWERVLDKMAGGVLVAASSTCDAIPPAFWRHATMSHELVAGELCDVFTRELEPVVVARTNGGGYAQSKREQHRNTTLCSADVRAAFPNLIEPVVKETASPEVVPESQAVPELATTDCETHDCEKQPVGLITVSKTWFRNPSDKILYDRVCELLAFDVTLAFETVLKEVAEELRMWPSDIVDQSRLIDRMKKRRARDKLWADA